MDSQMTLLASSRKLSRKTPAQGFDGDPSWDQGSQTRANREGSPFRIGRGGRRRKVASSDWAGGPKQPSPRMCISINFHFDFATRQMPKHYLQLQHCKIMHHGSSLAERVSCIATPQTKTKLASISSQHDNDFRENQFGLLVSSTVSIPSNRSSFGQMFKTFVGTYYKDIVAIKRNYLISASYNITTHTTLQHTSYLCTALWSTANPGELFVSTVPGYGETKTLITQPTYSIC